MVTVAAGRAALHLSLLSAPSLHFGCFWRLRVTLGADAGGLWLRRRRSAAEGEEVSQAVWGVWPASPASLRPRQSMA
jgi:hypothetical protein